MTVDVDIYDEDSQKVEIPAGSMPEDSPIKVRLCPCLLLLLGRDNEDEEKGQDGNPSDAGIPHSEGGRETQTYQGASILFSGWPFCWQRRRMQPIIYHKIVLNRTYSTINLQIKGFNPYKWDDW